jgi:hypothetical protein
MRFIRSTRASRARDLDVDVQAADHVAPAGQAQLARQGGVALGLGVGLARPAGDGVGAGGEDEQVVVAGHLG